MGVESEVQAAERFSFQSLLNCYLREVGIPEKQAILRNYREIRDCPVEDPSFRIFEVTLPYSQVTCIAGLTGGSELLGHYQFSSSRFFRVEGSPCWYALDAWNFAEILQKELSYRYRRPSEPDFLSQILHSL